MYEYDEIIETNGIKIPFIPQVITPKIERPMRNNRYEVGELKGLRTAIKAGDRVLELGGGISLISTAAAMIEGVGQVTTIEANPNILPVIRETHRLNSVDGVDLRNGFVRPGRCAGFLPARRLLGLLDGARLAAICFRRENPEL